MISSHFLKHCWYLFDDARVERPPTKDGTLISLVLSQVCRVGGIDIANIASV